MGLTPIYKRGMKEESRKILENKDIDNPIPIEEIAQSVGVGSEVVKRIIEDLITEGYSFSVEGDKVMRSKAIGVTDNRLDLSRVFKGRHIKFGVTSDKHIGSKHEQLDSLEAFYDLAAKEGVTEMFDAGDITEGWGVYKGQEFEVKMLGQDEQIDYACKVHPKRKKMTTYFITGNHDLRLKKEG